MTAAPATIVQTTLAEAAQALERLRNDSAMLARIEAAGALLADTFAAGGKVYSCGNGGSMCDAMHFAEELAQILNVAQGVTHAHKIEHRIRAG